MEDDTLDISTPPLAANGGDRIRARVDEVYRAESRRVFATLIRRLGDFDLAEEALHDAFRAALEQWPDAGVPANPRAWLVSVGRFKVIDRIRRRARIPYQIPTEAELPARLDAVLRVVYLVFNEGYAATSGPSLTRPQLSAEAIRLGRQLVGLLPDPETVGLLALMLLQESRRPARTSPAGWDIRPRPGRPTGALSTRPGNRRSGGLSSGDCRSWQPGKNREQSLICRNRALPIDYQVSPAGSGIGPDTAG